MKIAIVHDWLITYGGAERVLETMLDHTPEADLFALYDFIPPEERGFIRNKHVTTSFLQKFPLARTRYRNYLPLMPLAVEQFDLSGYDIVVSSSFAVAKGVITGPDQLHICMCYSPIRYAWDLMHQYLKEANLDRGVKSALTRYLLHRIRMWDYRTANGVDEFIAISEYIARRITKTYRRKSTVIYPPVNVDAFELHTQKDDYYLTAGRMVPYKKISLIVKAFAQMPHAHLVVIGDGPDFRKIKALAGPNVTLMGYQPSEILKQKMQRARAFIYAAEEDFGIVPVEAQACGTPVIAFGKGGSLETVIDNQTGLFFAEQTTDRIVEAVDRFEKMIDCFEPHTIRRNAERFSRARFNEEYRAFLVNTINRHRHRESTPDPVTIPRRMTLKRLEQAVRYKDE